MAAESTVPSPLEARLRGEVEELKEEVLRLQRKLGDLHAGDYNSLRRAYDSLCQHVSALEAEASGLTAAMAEFETQAVPPELVARELGVAAAVTFGVALLHHTVKVLPLKATGPVIAKGLWLLGGAFVLARLTGGTLAHVAASFSRNARRKRHMERKLRAVEERIEIMATLQRWTERQAPAGQPVEAGEQAAAPPPVPPPRRVSPAGSSGSGISAELVEMPQAEELEAAEAAAAEAAAVEAGEAGRGGAEGRQPATTSASASPRGGHQARPAAARSSGNELQSLKAYAELGR